MLIYKVRLLELEGYFTEMRGLEEYSSNSSLGISIGHSEVVPTGWHSSCYRVKEKKMKVLRLREY
jgi:hypothetical protein